MSCTNLSCSALFYLNLSCLDLSWRVLVVLAFVCCNVSVRRLQCVCWYTFRCSMFERVCAPASPSRFYLFILYNVHLSFSFSPLWRTVFLCILSTSYFRYIPAAAAFGGMCIGLLTVLADFLGTYAPAFEERMWRYHNRSHFFTLFSPSPLLTPHSFRDCRLLLTPFVSSTHSFLIIWCPFSLCRRHRVRHGHSPRSNYYLPILWNVREDQRWPQRLRCISSHTYVRTYALRPVLTQIIEVMLLPQND